MTVNENHTRKRLSAAAIDFPQNFATGSCYRGINVFLLGVVRYTSRHFLTVIQAKEFGGFVEQGEGGGMVIKYGTYTKEGEAAEASRTRTSNAGF